MASRDYLIVLDCNLFLPVQSILNTPAYSDVFKWDNFLLN